MRMQLSRNSGSTAFAGPCRRPGLVAAALLTALAPIAAAQAISFSDLAAADPVGPAWLVSSDFAITGSGGRAAKLDAYRFGFGSAGLTVTGPFAAPDGKSGGAVLSWTVAARDPAYLVTVATLFSRGGLAGTPATGDETFPALPELGVVPSGNLSVFKSGAVDVISWNFLEFGCALLALSLEDYFRLETVFRPIDYDLRAEASSSGFDSQQQVVPEPVPALLLGQGILVLALGSSIRLRSRCARCAGG
jgi:hypothetical protein